MHQASVLLRSMEMNQSDAMAAAASPKGKGRHDDTPGGSVLLDLDGCFANRPNATTAWSKTSTGLPISVSFSLAPPPALSQLSVHCPGLQQQLAADDQSLDPPKVAGTDADLVLLRVPLDPHARSYQLIECDYFVYRMHPRRPTLDLIPNPPYPDTFGDDEIAVLSRGGGEYVLARLRLMALKQSTPRLHLYRSTSTGGGGKPAGRWTSQLVSLEEPLRDRDDRVRAVPKSAQPMMYHLTSKAITIGGDGGTVGWVDLWRGILLCDVLSENPKLRDIPLPLPANDYTIRFLNYHSPCLVRNVAVNERRDTIKYVVMDFARLRQVPATPDDPDDYDSGSDYSCDYDGDEDDDDECQQAYYLVPSGCIVNTYSMPVPDASCDDWRHNSSVPLDNLKLPAENTRHYKVLRKLTSRSGNMEQEEATGTTTSSPECLSVAYPMVGAPAGCLSLAYPTIVGDDDDTLYLLSTGTCTGSTKAMVSIDLGTRSLQAVAGLDAERYFGFTHCCVASEISKHLETKGAWSGMFLAVTSALVAIYVCKRCL